MEGKIGEEQQGFRKGRGKTDGIFAQKRLVEKKLEGHTEMANAFVDLETTNDTIQKEMAMVENALW